MKISGWSQALMQAWFAGAWWLLLLRPLEWLFRILIALRRGLYAVGLLSSTRVSVPVVVVGNIAVGGTGKTPLVIALVEQLAARGLRCGVVARGYGARTGSQPRVVRAGSPVAEVGDEPLLIVQRTDCPCVVHPDRAAAAEFLVAQFDVDVVISDDGLQHYRLARDIEIALFDVERGFGNGRCLPAGPLREPPKRLSEVDFVLGRCLEGSSAEVVLTAGEAVNLHSGESREPRDFRGSVDAVAGIANPPQFSATLAALGIEHDLHVFPDHHPFTAADFATLGNRPIIMTEKDAVKCRSIVGEDAWYLPVTASVPDHVVERVAQLASSGVGAVADRKAGTSA